MFYGRMMFRLEAAPTDHVHWTIIAGSGVVPGQTYHALIGTAGRFRSPPEPPSLEASSWRTTRPPIRTAAPGRAAMWHHANKVVVPEGKWTCAEWKFDGTHNQMTLGLDGAPCRPHRHGHGLRLCESARRLHLGGAGLRSHRPWLGVVPGDARERSGSTTSSSRQQSSAARRESAPPHRSRLAAIGVWEAAAKQSVRRCRL